MKLTSPAIKHGQPIPKQYTEDGEDASLPLSWTDVPDSAVELALIMDDPDAPRDEPWVHWVAYHIPPTVETLPPGLPRDEVLMDPPGVTQGVNTWDEDNLGYRGPAPPKGHGTHHYHFRLYALDKQLGLDPRATKAQVLEKMQGHVLAEAELVGTYER